MHRLKLGPGRYNSRIGAVRHQLLRQLQTAVAQQLAAPEGAAAEMRQLQPACARLGGFRGSQPSAVAGHRGKKGAPGWSNDGGSYLMEVAQIFLSQGVGSLLSLVRRGKARSSSG